MSGRPAAALQRQADAGCTRRLGIERMRCARGSGDTPAGLCRRCRPLARRRHNKAGHAAFGSSQSQPPRWRQRHLVHDTDNQMWRARPHAFLERPEQIRLAGRLDNDQVAGRQPERRKPWRMQTTVLGRDRRRRRPQQQGVPLVLRRAGEMASLQPAHGKTNRKDESRGPVARRRRLQFMEAGHSEPATRQDAIERIVTERPRRPRGGGKRSRGGTGRG